MAAQGLLTIGTYARYPATSYGLITIGTYSPTAPTIQGLLTIGRYGESGVLPTYNPSLIIAVKRVLQNMTFPQFIIGGQGGASQNSYQLFKKSTSYGFNLWRSKVYLIGTDFDILSITFPLITTMVAGMTIVPKLYFDDQLSSAVGTTINLTNYPSNKLIKLTPASFSTALKGKHDFFLELQFTGSVLAPISLPIFIDLDIHEKF